MAKAEIIWTKSAQSDLYTLLDPLRVNAPKRAVRLMNQLLNAVSRLSDFPESGRRPVDITDDENIREIVVEQLRLFYDYHDNRKRIEIIAVFSARQNVEEMFRSRFGSE
jgi:toxin ParE1/3/4